MSNKFSIHLLSNNRKIIEGACSFDPLYFTILDQICLHNFFTGNRPLDLVSMTVSISRHCISSCARIERVIGNFRFNIINFCTPLQSEKKLLILLYSCRITGGEKASNLLDHCQQQNTYNFSLCILALSVVKIDLFFTFCFAVGAISSFSRNTVAFCNVQWLLLMLLRIWIMLIEIKY